MWAILGTYFTGMTVRQAVFQFYIPEESDVPKVRQLDKTEPSRNPSVTAI